MSDPQFYKIEFEGAWPETQWWECRSCGRQYYDIPECDDYFSPDSVCPESECPSHWEEQGIPHPNYL